MRALHIGILLISTRYDDEFITFLYTFTIDEL